MLMHGWYILLFIGFTKAELNFSLGESSSAVLFHGGNVNFDCFFRLNIKQTKNIFPIQSFTVHFVNFLRTYTKEKKV